MTGKSSPFSTRPEETARHGLKAHRACVNTDYFECLPERMKTTPRLYGMGSLPAHRAQNKGGTAGFLARPFQGAGFVYI